MAQDSYYKMDYHIRKMIQLIENSHMNTPGAKEWKDEAEKILGMCRVQGAYADAVLPAATAAAAADMVARAG